MCIFFADLMIISMPKKDTYRDRLSANFLESHKEKLFVTKFYYITPFHSYQVQESFHLLQESIEPNLVFILKVVSRFQPPKDCSLIFPLYVGKLVIKQFIRQTRHTSPISVNSNLIHSFLRELPFGMIYFP